MGSLTEVLLVPLISTVCFRKTKPPYIVILKIQLSEGRRQTMSNNDEKNAHDNDRSVSESDDIRVQTEEEKTGIEQSEEERIEKERRRLYFLAH